MPVTLIRFTFPPLMPRLSLVSLQLSLLSLLSAFLLFQVQPLISKFILPWFGGSPGVWTTCMVFFQVVLFAGYAYAHLLGKLPHRWQGVVHGGLVLVAALWLPIAPEVGWKPTGTEDPSLRILLLLLASVGLPYFVLSSTSPLVQVWFSRAVPGSSPWRLYALSNVGSLVALLSYPFFFEPRWDVQQQAWLWSLAFGAFILLSGWAAWRDGQGDGAGDARPTPATVPSAPRLWQRLLWLLLPATATAMLLAATNHVCQDVAVVPFLWVVPLSLYLLTFIICFEHERWYRPLLWALPAMALLFIAAGYESPIKQWLEEYSVSQGHSGAWAGSFAAQLLVYFGAMFFVCMVCHGELARCKPDAAHLTEFYLLMSAGGALGGLLVSLVAPRIFSTYIEWPIGLLVGFGMAGIVVLRAVWRLRYKWLRSGIAFIVVVVLVAGSCFMQNWGFTLEDRVERVRNFYGTISVEREYDDESTSEYVRLHYGGIVHGLQVLAPESRFEPLSYYGRDTGIGIALISLGTQADVRVGVVGMGSATVAAYGGPGNIFRFYEINPAIVPIALHQFTYISDMEDRGAKAEIVMGDARLSLEREAPQHFDVLLLDAFSGDSVPVHLLTVEAFQIYAKHMKPTGIIAVHCSNRYLELAQIIEKVATSVGMKTTRIITEQSGDDEYTDYVLVTNNEPFLKAHPPETLGYEKDLPVSLWTDKSHNLFEILDR